MSNVHKQYDYFDIGQAYVITEEDIVTWDKKKEAKPSPEGPDDNVNALDVESIIAEAEKRAQEIIADAEKEAFAIRKKAADKGHAEGIAQGLTEGRQKGFDEYKELISQAGELLDNMHEEKYQLLNSMEKEMLELSVAIAEKIIDREISENPLAFSSVIAKALKKAAGAERVSVYISPNQYDRYESIDELKHELKKRVNIIKSFDIVKEELSDSLDCMVVTEFEEIDAGVKTQVKQIKQALNLTESVV